MTSIPFHSKALNKTVYAVPDPRNGEYRVCFDADGKNYWMNMSHVMIKSMDDVTVPPVLRENISERALSFLSFSQHRTTKAPPDVAALQSAMDSYMRQGWSLTLALRTIETDYGVSNLKVNDQHKITWWEMSEDVIPEIETDL